MKKMKRIVPNIAAMKARLEKNKENAKRSTITNEENPMFKVEGPGTYEFRATYYPHSEDPAAEPFLTRHYHFGIPGTGIVFCPQENDGETCHLCDFIWGMMKEHKGTEEVKEWAKKLPKMRVWIPGQARGREEEGVKFFSVGTRKEEMSENHAEIMEWFFNSKTQDWLSHTSSASGGFDMSIKYEQYKASKAGLLGAKFGLQSVSLARESTDFGGDFEDFMSKIPNIDDNDLPVLRSYTKKVTADTLAALEKWNSRLDKDNKKVSSSRLDSVSSEISTSDDEDVEIETSNKENNKTREKLRALGLSV